MKFVIQEFRWFTSFKCAIIWFTQKFRSLRLILIWESKFSWLLCALYLSLICDSMHKGLTKKQYFDSACMDFL